MQKFSFSVIITFFAFLTSSLCFADGERNGIIPGKLAWRVDSIIEQWTLTEDVNSDTIEQSLFNCEGKPNKDNNSTPIEERYNRQLVITLGFINLSSEIYRFDSSSRLEASINQFDKTVRVDAVPTINKTVIAPNGRVKKSSFILKMNNRAFNQAFNKLYDIDDLSINPACGKLLIEDSKGNSLLDNVQNPAEAFIHMPFFVIKHYIFPEPESNITFKDALLAINKSDNLFTESEKQNSSTFSIDNNQIASVLSVPNHAAFNYSNNDLGWILLFLFNDNPVDNDKTASVLSKQLESKDSFHVGIVPVDMLKEYFPVDETNILSTFSQCIEKLPETVAPKRYQEVNIKSVENMVNPYKILKEYAESGDNEAIDVIFKDYDLESTKQLDFISELFPDSKSYFLWLKQLADKGYSAAQHGVGLFYENGVIVKENLDKALKYYKLAADQDNDNAMVCYANVLYRKNKKQNLEETIEWYRKAAERKNLRGQYLLAITLLASKDEEENQEGILWLQQSASEGYPSAMYDLAMEYYFGAFVPKDEKKAFSLMEKAAIDKGFIKAFDVLGDFYMRGIGVEPNGKRAVLCYQIAAEKGVPSSMYWYGRFLCDGFNVEKDVKKGYSLITNAAKNNCSDAMLFLGLDFYQGKIAKKNNNDAFYWIEKAANQGNERAMAVLGDFYTKGVGINTDIKKGIQWYKKSADEECPYGIFRWGQHLYEQKGINAQMGLNYIKAAAKMGEENAQEYLKKIDSSEEDNDLFDDNDIEDLDDEDEQKQDSDNNNQLGSQEDSDDPFQ